MEETKNWYDKSYKFILLIPLALLLISIIYLFNFNSQHGDVIYKDVTLTGGTTITVFDSSIGIEEVIASLSEQFPDIKVRTISDFRTGEQKGFILETKADVGEIRPALESFLSYELTQENSSIEFSGATLSQGFYQQLRLAILLAFLFMAIVVFIIFRTIVPSAAVILAALSDIVMTVVVIDLIRMPLSTAGIVAFLLLIGYSVDTDILLTTRVLKKREGEINTLLFGALKTGLTMTLTSILAVSVSLFVIYSSSEVLRQMFTILLIGLGFDLFNTWFANASILKWYAEKREAR
ncbi:MAG: protein translocase subunit SecF [Nanoarchaeota archaeon]|nr:protein translocase subunit SecF [Nanoarchaeota archaeon]MBU1051080.1 protein translocase subunit SecF [Nanoarchaeota archaeon]MBU1988487.1 protein translocase subunit SecF [Nanoarchaeota archaeon]